MEAWTMIGFTLRRLSQLVPVLIVSSAIVFLLMRLVPGDPVVMMVGEHASLDVQATVRHQLGLDQPLPLQYLAWLGRILRGDLGSSYFSKLPVLDLVAQAAPATAELALASLALALVVALPLGLLSALHQGSR